MLTELVLGTTGVTAGLATWGALRSLRRGSKAQDVLEEARARGSNRPASLHPVVDLELCIGSGACVNACPEDVLAYVDGRPHLVEAGSCVGHGACKTSCPLDAIRLVIGSAERGVDLPELSPDYETNVPGIFVAGELGGMGLIRNAFRQGTQAIETAAASLKPNRSSDPRLVDVLIVGAGPAGIAAALKAKQLGLSYTLLEQYKLGGAVTHYPRKKLVLTERMDLPLEGTFGQREMSKEQLVGGFEKIVAEHGIQVREHHRVTKLTGEHGRFRLEAMGPKGQRRFAGRTVILAIGRRGTPRKLGVLGEEQPHVVYRLIDPTQYRGQQVLVVGGGDSAVEAALALSDVARTTVRLSYRRSGFSRIKRKNREKLDAAMAAGKVEVLLNTNVLKIGEDFAILGSSDGMKRIEADAVIVNAGGVLPDSFLRAMGVEVVTCTGETVNAASAPSAISVRLVAAAATTARVSARSSRRLASWVTRS